MHPQKRSPAMNIDSGVSMRVCDGVPMFDGEKLHGWQCGTTSSHGISGTCQSRHSRVGFRGVHLE
jgi:hypothetical protein